MGTSQMPSDRHLEQLLHGPLERLACLGSNGASDGETALYLHGARTLRLLIDRLTQVHSSHALLWGLKLFKHLSGQVYN